MPTYRRNLHLGTKDPLIETDDISDGAITWMKLSPELRALLQEICRRLNIGMEIEVAPSAPYIEVTDITSTKYPELGEDAEGCVFSIAITSDDDDVEYYYKLNGSDEWKEYEEPFEIFSNGENVIIAKAVRGELTSDTYQIAKTVSPRIYKSEVENLAVSFSGWADISKDGGTADPKPVSYSYTKKDYYTDGREEESQRTDGATVSYSIEDAAEGVSIVESTGVITLNTASVSASDAVVAKGFATVTIGEKAESSQKYDIKQTHATFSVTAPSGKFTPDGASSDCNVSASRGITSVMPTSNQNWVTPTYADGKIHLVISASGIATERTAKITVTTNIDGLSEEFNVVQNGAYHEVSPTSLSVNNTEQTKEVTITKHGNITIEQSNVSCDGTVVKSATLNGNKVSITISENNTATKRNTGYVTVKSNIDSAGKTCSVSQEAAAYWYGTMAYDELISAAGIYVLQNKGTKKQETVSSLNQEIDLNRETLFVAFKSGTEAKIGLKQNGQVYNWTPTEIILDGYKVHYMRLVGKFILEEITYKNS